MIAMSKSVFPVQSLDPHQVFAIEWLKHRPKAIVAPEQGLGKTIIAAVDLVAPCLIVCPTTLKYNWLDELKTWRPELKVQLFSTAKDQVDPTADVWISGYETIQKIKPPKPTTLIIDEAHYIKNPTSARTGKMMRLIGHVERVRALTGTPLVNRPIDLWPILHAMDAVKLDYHEFGLRYCGAWYTPWKKWDYSGLSNEESLTTLLSKYMLRLTKAQCLKDLPEKIYKVIELDLPVDKREKNLNIDEIEASDNVAFEAISDILKMNAERKLPQATQYIIDALVYEPKVVVFAFHSDIIDALLASLSEYNPVHITGSVEAKRRHAAVKKFQEDPECRVFIGNYKAAGVGITLTAANRVIFVESSWTPADIEQSADRCHRRGQKSTVNVDILTIHKSIDAQMLHTVIGKMGIISKLIKETDMNSIDRIAIANLFRQLASHFDPVTNQVPDEAPKAEAPKAEAPKAEAPKAEAPKAEAPKAEAPKQPKAPKTGEVTLDQLRELIAKLIASGKRDQALHAVTKQGASKLSELSVDKYAVVFEELSPLAE